MKSFYLLMAVVIFTGGCVAHTFQIHGDTLTLYLKKPGAQKVTVFCSLDGFEPHTARYVHGHWEVALPAANPFRYFYVVDGHFYLPACLLKERDDFGSENCIFYPRL